jgi:hypothetical protein
MTDPTVPYPEHLIHTYLDGTQMRSKSEMLIAAILDDMMKRGDIKDWEYERPIKVGDRTAHPDFTVVLSNGREILWEHTGRADRKGYQQADSKQDWYAAHGIDNYIWTYDLEDGGFDMRGVEAEAFVVMELYDPTIGE